ncbi:zf-HC2 domain-containing protein [Amycolatopsis sp. YIM 10]|uniref:zf-HC2 domain-containing protein n=1 Tax=Amycolatopsis sp. YIM 10 TaxID=2653857 RepID=UPI001290180D|nr:zf-HC2 domain-containing protein [Amycolatopsis sp. YIM 10]QFU89068.1 hypothetical protein YIM_19445 [Amycolatopsis sp. YIM 10]
MTDRDHASAELIGRYVRGGEIAPEAEWALEAHLENCAACRARLAEVNDETVTATITAVWSAMEPELAASTPAPARRLRSRLARWLPPAMLSWLTAATLIAVVATFLGQWTGTPDGDSVLFLLAPVVPVLGVAAAWSASLDPMYELTTASPRAGLFLLLRRTLTVLVLVLPVLGAESLLVGTSPLLWLLPGLACTLVALALGSLFGVERAAVAVAGAWLAGFAPPVVIGDEPPELFGAWNPALWIGVAALAAVVLVLRGSSFTLVSPGGSAPAAGD